MDQGDDYFSDEEYPLGDFDFLKPSSEEIHGTTSGLTCEVKLYEARYSLKGEQVPLQVGKHRVQEAHGQNDDHNSAMVFTRWYDSEQKLDRTQLVIRSPFIKQALKEVIKEYPGVNLKAGDIVISDLPKCLFHYREELQAYALQSKEPLLVQHVLLLLKHMWDQLQSQYLSYLTLMDPSSFLPGLEYTNLWMAFRPGDQLYMKTQGSDLIVKMLDMSIYGDHWNVNFVYIVYDGKSVGYTKDSCRIDAYDAYWPISSLRIFPLVYHADAASIREKTIMRGMRMMELRGVQYKMYNGAKEELSKDRNTTFKGQLDVFPLRSANTRSRIMIDAKTFGEKKPYNSVLINEAYGRLPKYTIQGTDFYDLTPEHYMICGRQVPGFSLADKKWCWFNIDDISEIEFNTRAFEQLLLPQEQKDMIYSLVEVHKSNDFTFDDVIKGKGKGMIFLLHGEPGVGKTLTAESVADQTKRPLYTISSGELGVQPSEVETNLKAALDLATTWNAIVLIDEADVFLEQRTINHLERNSLVSILMRQLEYYEGILILTTNRIEAFDAAFKSRIHLAIKFHALPPEYRARLWKQFISRAATGLQVGAEEWIPYPVSWLTEDYLDQISKEEINGRQIKNIVRTANALALSAKVPLEPSHVQTALRAMKLFESDFSESHEMVDSSRSPKRRRIE